MIVELDTEFKRFGIARSGAMLVLDIMMQERRKGGHCSAEPQPPIPHLSIHPGGKTKFPSLILRCEAGPWGIKDYHDAGLSTDGAMWYILTFTGCGGGASVYV